MTGQMMYARPPYYPPVAGTVIDMDGQGQQQTQTFPQTNVAYPPMPVALAHTAGATSPNAAATSMTGSTYVVAQDGSANLTNAEIQEGIPAVPPPPYTPAIPK
ncbi:hypothetical protein BGZ96_011362 [Linnemannia gamsii]|uniref:Uncharacterized protein n=1 Tax=Linnemannia gamsii TaxID=64522 RepID=A0ABQ7JTC1_9FUNG|nr:hypothetical protein BGZ96_011362 [Linnemannia gamsii]